MAKAVEIAHHLSCVLERLLVFVHDTKGDACIAFGLNLFHCITPWLARPSPGELCGFDLSCFKRRRLIWQYLRLQSQPIQRRESRSALHRVEPRPQKQSRILSPVLVSDSMIQAISSTGFGQGWSSFNSSWAARSQITRVSRSGTSMGCRSRFWTTQVLP